MKYEIREIVIGGTFDAVAHAFVNDLPILYLQREEPHRFEQLYYGPSRAETYCRLLFLLSLKGKVLFGDKVKSIRISDNIISATVSETERAEIEFSKALVFDERGLQGLGAPKKKPKARYVVYDWFNVRSGMCHEHEQIETDSDFVNCMLFYPSDRIDGDHDKKDFIARSYMSEEQLDDIEYMEAYVRFKCLKLMKDLGIRGAKNGVCPNTGKSKHYALKIESASREAINLSRAKYANTKYLTFVHTKNKFDEEILAKEASLIDGTGLTKY